MASHRGRLCVSLTPATPDEIFQTDLTGADLVEVRLDYLQNPQAAREISWTRFPVPVIATCRREVRGGRFAGTAADERRILESAARNGAAFVDIDYRDAQPIPGARLIGSYHDFDSTPDDVGRRLEQACATEADVAKVATMVRSWTDNRRLLQLLAQPWPKPVIVIGMGEIGEITRLIGPSRGSFLTYASAKQTSGGPAAPGQIGAQDVLNIYRFRKIGPKTQIIGVLGHPVAHSLSPVLHNRAFDTMNLDLVYLKFPVTDLDDFFANARSIGIGGISVTIPHKTVVIKHLAELTPTAAETGAVNTIVERDGRWIGDNTDVHGVRAALASAGFSSDRKTVGILGSGGAARAAAAAVKDARQTRIFSRSKPAADHWPANVCFDTLENAGKAICDLLINATPVGMSPDAGASPLSGAIPATVVFDMVYSPALTELLRTAAAQGKRIIPGTTMFLAQAASQFQIWTGQEPRPELYGPEAMPS